MSKSKLQRRSSNHNSPSVKQYQQPEDEVEYVVDENARVMPAQMQDFIKGIGYGGYSDDEAEQKPASPKSKKKAAAAAAAAAPKAKVDTGMVAEKKPKPVLVKASVIETDIAAASNDDDDSGCSEDDEDQPRKPTVPKKRGKLTEFEMALLWNQFKDNHFPGGRVNKLQLSQILRQVFPKCESEHLDGVVVNVMHIFDTQDVGTVSFRELLTTFALSIAGCSLRDKLIWTYRLLDEEGNEELDNDDLVDIVVKLCEFSKKQEEFARTGSIKKPVETAKPETPPPETINPPSPPPLELTPKMNKKKKPEKEVTLMSNRMGYRTQNKSRKKKKEAELKKLEAEQNKSTEDEVSTVKAASEDEPKFALDDSEKELVKAAAQGLDVNRDGIITKEEFVDGCLADPDFMQLVNCFKGESVWGDILIGLPGGGGGDEEEEGEDKEKQPKVEDEGDKKL